MGFLRVKRLPAVLAAWKVAKVGAGGFVTGIDIASDGTMVCRTDAYGAYRWDATNSKWVQLFTTNSFSSSDWSIDIPQGCNEIRIAPSLTSRFYMQFNGYLYRSNNSGATWLRTAYTQQTGNPSTDSATKGFGPYLAIDPANPDVILASSPSAGLFMSTDGGATWTKITAVGTGAATSGSVAGGHLICFDRTSSVVGGKTQGIYVSTYGTGVYHSTDGGATWTLTTGGPTTHRHMICPASGVLWLIADGWPDGTNANKFSGGAWTAISFGFGSQGNSIAIDPSNPSHLFVATPGGELILSTDTGATWSAPVSPARTATDIPWLANTNESFFSNGDICFDASGNLFVAEGIGVWKTSSPANSPVPWVSQSAGIEELIGNSIVATPNGDLLVTAWDRPVFRLANPPDSYPSNHGPNYANEIILGASIDWAENVPSTIVGIFNLTDFSGPQIDVSGKSTDGGATWTAFGSIPAEVNSGVKSGGCIAAGSNTNYLWAPSNNPTHIYYTTDGGVTWTASNFTSGPPTTGGTGWSFAFYLNRTNIAADRVNAGTFYAYNSGSDDGTKTGLYKSIDGGANFTRVFTGEIANFTGYNCTLKAVPGQAGHLFFTSGPQSPAHPSSTAFRRSTDGGATWADITGFSEVQAFGFGAIYSGQSYPAVCAVGWNNNVFGIWESRDNCVTWTQIGDYPLGIFSTIKSIDGDKQVAGRWYVATATGWFYFG